MLILSLWAVSWASRVKKVVYLNYCSMFIVYTQFTNVAAGFNRAWRAVGNPCTRPGPANISDGGCPN